MSSKIVRAWGGTFLFGFSLKLFGIGFLTFPFYDEADVPFYSEDDLRMQTGLFPFPLIFHYNSGGDTSECPFSRIMREIALADIPAQVSAFLAEQAIDSEQIQCFEAWCMPLYPTMNYFTHPWAMDRMVENREVLVASGMFNPVNLSPTNGEIGINTVITQNMYFHDRTFLSRNCARFKMVDFTIPAKAWFVSIYDPSSNPGKNAEINQIKRAIVVYWHFIPDVPEQIFVETLSGEIIDIYGGDGDPTGTLHPLFTPQK